jgi:hypothetical protein
MRIGWLGSWRRKARKNLLFLKRKKQKDFYLFRVAPVLTFGARCCGQQLKVFCFFSSEKKTFLS